MNNSNLYTILLTVVIITLTGVVLYRYILKKYKESINKQQNSVIIDLSNKFEKEEFQSMKVSQDAIRTKPVNDETTILNHKFPEDNDKVMGSHPIEDNKAVDSKDISNQSSSIPLKNADLIQQVMKEMKDYDNSFPLRHNNNKKK